MITKKTKVVYFTYLLVTKYCLKLKSYVRYFFLNAKEQPPLFPASLTPHFISTSPQFTLFPTPVFTPHLCLQTCVLVHPCIYQIQILFLRTPEQPPTLLSLFLGTSSVFFFYLGLLQYFGNSGHLPPLFCPAVDILDWCLNATFVLYCGISPIYSPFN